MPVPSGEAPRTVIGNITPMRTVDGRVQSISVSFSPMNKEPSWRSTLFYPDPGVLVTAARNFGDELDTDAWYNLAVEVVRATACPTGPVVLNNGFRRISSRSDIQRIQNENGGDVLNLDWVIPDGIEGERVSGVRREFSAGIAVYLNCNETAARKGEEPTGTSVSSRRTVTSDTAEAWRTVLSNRTFVSFTDVFGTQVNYLAPDGSSHLWFPGNQRVVVGSWEVEGRPGGSNTDLICYQYPNARNPVTGAVGNRSCIRKTQFDAHNIEEILGDAFDLQSGDLPFVMDRGRRYNIRARDVSTTR